MSIVIPIIVACAIVAYLITKAAERDNERFDRRCREHWAAVFDDRDAYAKKQADEAREHGKDW